MLQAIQLLEEALAVVVDDREALIDDLLGGLGFVAIEQGRTEQHELRRDAELIAGALILVQG